MIDTFILHSNEIEGTIEHTDENKQNNMLSNLRFIPKKINENEIFKDTIYNNYSISNYGNVYNNYKHKYVTILPNNCIRLHIKGKQTDIPVDRLVLETFYPNIKYDYIVPIIHINNNKSDNNLINLKYKEINENEIFKIIENSNYLISNYGNVMNKQTNRLLKSSIHKDTGYSCVHLTDLNGNRKNRYIHLLVAKEFLNKDIQNEEIDENKKLYVIHINQNRNDNNVKNLCYSNHLILK